MAEPQATTDSPGQIIEIFFTNFKFSPTLLFFSLPQSHPNKQPFQFTTITTLVLVLFATSLSMLLFLIFWYPFCYFWHQFWNFWYSCIGPPVLLLWLLKSWWLEKQNYTKHPQYYFGYSLIELYKEYG